MTPDLRRPTKNRDVSPRLVSGGLGGRGTEWVLLLCLVEGLFKERQQDVTRLTGITRVVLLIPTDAVWKLTPSLGSGCLPFRKGFRINFSCGRWTRLRLKRVKALPLLPPSPTVQRIR